MTVPRKELDKALNAYGAALAIRGRLAEKDPENAVTQSYLATLYGHIGDVVLTQNNPGVALEHYRRAFAIRDALAIKDSNNVSRQHSLITSGDKLGDLLVAENKLDEAVRVHRVVLASMDSKTCVDPMRKKAAAFQAGTCPMKGVIAGADGRGAAGLRGERVP